RKIDGRVKSIPLSCVRDWSHKKEALRAARAMNKPHIADEWPKATNPKTLRFVIPGFTKINVSRSIEGKFSRGTAENPGVIAKPKFTVAQLQKDDVVTLVCDGEKDYVTESENVALIAKKTGLANNTLL